MRSYPGSLPDSLAMRNGARVASQEQWESTQRPRILDWFRQNVYGQEPNTGWGRLSFRTGEVRSALGGTAVRKDVDIAIEGPYGTCTMHVVAFLPSAQRETVPAFLTLYFHPSDLDPEIEPNRDPFSPVRDLVRHGYAAVGFCKEDIDPDYDDGFQNGVHGIFDPPERLRAQNAWGAIAAWAWGASRVMDYLETDAAIDAHRVALVGHSRLGKAALWAGAVDQRFAMVVSNNSGCTGAAISRGKDGETIRDINTRFPHWFCKNYEQFNDHEDKMPMDQHMLLSLLAPRLLYVTSASNDTWADPVAEFLSVTLQEPVYRLYGYQGLAARSEPYPDIPLVGDRIGYHMRTGEHGLTEFDWRCIISFADARLGNP